MLDLNGMQFTRQTRIKHKAEAMPRGARSCLLAQSRQQLADLALGGNVSDRFVIACDVPGRGIINCCLSRGTLSDFVELLGSP